MRFREFVDKYRDYPVISTKDLAFEGGANYVRRLITDWLKKGWLLELKRGLYVINEPSYKESLSTFFLANILYAPSYVSLDSALSFYAMIPETVLATTSISTRKTTEFENAFGIFRYANLKRDLFFGFGQTEIVGHKVFLAYPEKALLDLLYLRRMEFSSGVDALESLRLEGIKKLRLRIIRDYLNQFANRRLEKLCKELLAA